MESGECMIFDHLVISSSKRREQTSEVDMASSESKKCAITITFILNDLDIKN